MVSFLEILLDYFPELDCLRLISSFVIDDAIQDEAIVVEGRNRFC